MTEYVDRKAVRDKLIIDDAITMKGLAILNRFPASNVEVVRRGKWIEMDGCMTICSECNTLGCGTRYCSNCGARMEGYNG